MVRLLAHGAAGGTDRGPGGPPVGRRERNRLVRHRRYLGAAMRIVATDGLDGLTMQRLADDVDAAVGTIYTYFPSKGALVAEVQRAAIERLTESCVLLRADVERKLSSDERSVPIRALTRAVAIGRFWAATTETFPHEAQLMQALMTEQREIMTADDIGRVLPAAVRHLDLARTVLDDAADLGVLHAADAWERVVTWLAAIGGVVQVSRLAPHDEELFDGIALARRLNHDLLLGWGADPSLLAAAEGHVDRLAARGPLAPPTLDAPTDAPEGDT